MAADPTPSAKPAHLLRVRPAVEAALARAGQPLSPELQTLHEAETAVFRLRIMRTWIFVVAAIEVMMLWGDWLSGAPTFRLGLVLRLALNMPLATAVFLALPRADERGRAFLFALYNTGLIALICIESHYALPAFANQYIVAAGLIIGGANMIIPLTLLRATLFTVVATVVYAVLSLAPLGPHPVHAPDLLVLLVILGVASLRARSELCASERDAFLLRLQDRLNTQDIVFANSILLDLANVDALTRVTNRRHFDERLTGSCLPGSWPQAGLGLLMIDVDGFQSYNAHYGAPAGDACLRIVAKAMSRELHQGCETLARYGADEFAVLLPGFGLAEMQETGLRLCRVIEALGLPHDARCDGPPIVTISIGAAIASVMPDSPQGLVRAADRALQEARRRGGNQICSAAGAAGGIGHVAETSPLAAGVATLSRSASLADDLRGAMLGGHLHLQYQPIYRAADDGIAAFEVLLRWTHPLHGAISPSTFIAAAEESGVIVPVGKWVLRQACAQAASWTVPHVLAVNISPVQFSDPELATAIFAILQESGLAPQRLLLEITEGLQLVVSDGVRETLQSLRAHGVGIALDDFGTGYANLHRLRDFTFDVVKIDHSFLDSTANFPDPVAMLRPLIAFARAYGPKIVMEGVETADQLALVKALGCDWVQGYFLSRPLSVAALPAVMQAAPKPAAILVPAA